jgi:hypothetical protein
MGVSVYSVVGTNTSHILRRSPRGERGLKHRAIVGTLTHICRSPRGERGLKRTAPV